MKLKGLHELGALQQALQQREQARRDAETRERAARARREAERDVFARAVGTVAPMRGNGRVELPPPRPAPEPRQRLRDEQAVLREAVSDEFDAASLLDTDADLAYRRNGVGPDIVRKLRRGHWAVQAQLDLHGLRRDQAREALGRFVRACLQQGLRCVRIVHGKGHGSPGREPVLKAKVRSWLAQRQEVLAFVHARGDDGGHGAVVVLLDGSAATAPPR